MSNTVQRAPGVAGQQPEPGTGTAWRYLRQAGLFLARQREATVFIVVVLLIVYFGFARRNSYLGRGIELA